MNRRSISFPALALIVAAGLPLVAFAGTDAAAANGAEKTAAAPADAVIAEQLPTYPLTTCPVSGEDLSAMGKAVDFVYEGRLVRFCCPKCESRFTADPAKYLATIDAAVVQAQAADYPLEVCPVSGNRLGAMGEPYEYVHGTRLVRFCCPGCVDEFETDPASFLAKIDAARPDAVGEAPAAKEQAGEDSGPAGS